MFIHIPIVKAFIDGAQGGNPAGIVLDAERFSSREKQQIATLIGLSETAFVSPSDKADLKLEFFTPNQQIPHCGHATIATFSYLKQIGLLKNDRTSKETIDGCRQILIKGEAAYMEQSAPHYKSISPSQLEMVLQALGITQADLIDVVPQVVNTGNSFLVIGLRDSDTIRSLSVDLALVEDLSNALDLIGFYVFSLTGIGEGRDAGTRMFAPRYGIAEEAATGMAAGPLACFIHDVLKIDKPSYLIEQGHWMPLPSPSLLDVQLRFDDAGEIAGLYAGGRAAVSESRTVEVQASGLISG